MPKSPHPDSRPAELPGTSRKTGILLVAFGASGHVAQQTLAGFEQHVRGLYPETPVRWAFTSEWMRTRLTAAKKKTDSIHKALMRMYYEKYTHIAVQPLHIIPGAEYNALKNAVRRVSLEHGLHTAVGAPLLTDRRGIDCAAEALLAHLPEERAPQEPVLFVGHGTWHKGGVGYGELALAVRKKDPAVFIGTLEGGNAPEVIASMKRGTLPVSQQGSPGHSGTEGSTPEPLAGQPADLQDSAGKNGHNRCGTAGNTVQETSNQRRVWLLPLLSVIGRHAEVDIAGNHDQSWKHMVEQAGFQCTPVLKGTAEYASFIAIWARHLSEAMKKV